MSNFEELQISISVGDGNEDDLDNLTRQLSSELQQLDIEKIDNALLGGAPMGTKALDWRSVGELIVTLSPAIIPSLFSLLRSWVERKPSVPVKIRIKVGKNKTAQIEYDPVSTSSEELEELVKTLMRSMRR